MKRIRAIDAVMARHWAIVPDHLEMISSIALRENDTPEAVAKRLGRPLDNTRKVTVRDGVAIIPVTGPIFPRANLMTAVSGATSLDVLSDDLHKAIDDDAITGILLDIDSPGGVAFGPGEMAEMIRAAGEIKPITAYVSGMAASAAYWIASAAGEIVAHRTSELGSIGVVTARRVQETPDQHGERTIEIVSSNAANKRPDPTTDEGMAEIKKQLDALENEFVSSVAEYRGVSVDRVIMDFGRGGLHIAAEAVRVGMADRTGSFEEVLSELSQRSTSQMKGSFMTEKNGPTPAAKEAGEDVKAVDIDAVKKEGFDDGYQKGLTEGAEKERERLTAIDDIARPGFETLVSKAKADGKSTAADVALAMAKVEKDRGANYLAETEKAVQAQPEIEPSGANEPAPAAEEDHTLSLEDRAKAAWNKDENLRSEFGNNFDAYLGYRKGSENGQIRIKSGR